MNVSSLSLVFGPILMGLIMDDDFQQQKVDFNGLDEKDLLGNIQWTCRVLETIILGHDDIFE